MNPRGSIEFTKSRSRLDGFIENCSRESHTLLDVVKTFRTSSSESFSFASRTATKIAAAIVTVET